LSEAGPSSDVPAEVEGAFLPDRPHRTGDIIRIGSREGVWGLVAGFGVMTAGTLGAPISLGLAISLMGAGLIVSGIGTGVTSWWVLRKAQPQSVLVRLASVLGIPLGGALAILGATSLFRWAPLINLVNWITPVAGILGGLVLVILVIRFLIGTGAEADDAA